MVPPVTVVGVGIDLVDLERVRRLLADKGEHAMTRFFSDNERRYLATRPDATGHAAARIAAKEAVYKAMHLGTVAAWCHCQGDVDSAKGALADLEAVAAGLLRGA